MHSLKSHPAATVYIAMAHRVVVTVMLLGLASAVYGESNNIDSDDAVEDHDQLRRGQLFRQADRDNDGKISLNEYRKLAQERADQRFRQIDKNGDEAIDRDEVRAAAELAGMRRRSIRELQKTPND